MISNEHLSNGDLLLEVNTIQEEDLERIFGLPRTDRQEAISDFQPDLLT